MKPILIALIALAPTIARAQAPATTPLPTVALPAELGRVLRDYERGWQGNDAAALAALFTEDGFVLSTFILALRRSAGGPWLITGDIDNGNQHRSGPP